MARGPRGNWGSSRLAPSRAPSRGDQCKAPEFAALGPNRSAVLEIVALFYRLSLVLQIVALFYRLSPCFTDCRFVLQTASLSFGLIATIGAFKRILSSWLKHDWSLNP